MHECMNQLTTRRLEKFSFIQHSQMLRKRNLELLDHMIKPLPTAKTVSLWTVGNFSPYMLKYQVCKQRLSTTAGETVSDTGLHLGPVSKDRGERV